MSKTRSPITTHILDISQGKAAGNVGVLLEKQDSIRWKEIRRSVTNADGRVEDLMPAGTDAEAGTYRLTFETDAYFRSRNIESFYPFVTVVFEIKAATEHYHVPLLLSPFGYSTYRGT